MPVEKTTGIFNFDKDLSKKKFDTTTGIHGNFFNVGYGKHYTILEIAKIIKHAIGYKGDIKFDKSYPDGVNQKLMNSKKINKIGWKPKHNFKKYLKKELKSERI